VVAGPGTDSAKGGISAVSSKLYPVLVALFLSTVACYDIIFIFNNETQENSNGYSFLWFPNLNGERWLTDF
jgi:hypothetical protein